jgi:hypothetical protein
MQVSEQAYEKAKIMLAFIQNNPGSHMKLIADDAAMLKATAHITIQKMVSAGVLTFTTKRHQGGKRHYYQATGIPLPARVPVKKVRIDQVEQTLLAEPVAAESFRALPGFIRALTPAIEAPAARAVCYFGHTQEQHLKQSAIMRQERKTRGAMYTGVARI